MDRLHVAGLGLEHRVRLDDLVGPVERDADEAQHVLLLAVDDVEQVQLAVGRHGAGDREIGVEDAVVLVDDDRAVALGDDGLEDGLPPARLGQAALFFLDHRVRDLGLHLGQEDVDRPGQLADLVVARRELELEVLEADRFDRVAQVQDRVEHEVMQEEVQRDAEQQQDADGADGVFVHGLVDDLDHALAADLHVEDS
ncbi:MAG: hypothetical protein M0D55_14270 [Elusimicrobiota bacterium]|nr:MAG: hypothetical protein M0D55_14270 [Elusimicrobiota bacterium]